MSIETTLARGALADAERERVKHVINCPACAAASRRRQPGCSDGARLREIEAEARAELKRQRELDKAPNPDQLALFTEGEVSQ